MHHVFISYSSKNKVIADRICSHLESNGIFCWYAPRDILPGKDWAEAIMEAIDSAKIFLLIYSSESNESRQVSNEVTAAFNAGCTLVPYRVSSDKMCGRLAYYLNSVHLIDATGSFQSRNLDNLLSHLRILLNIPAQTKPATSATVKTDTKINPATSSPLNPIQALCLLVDQSSACPDATVTVRFQLGIDASQADQQVRSAVVLPYGSGVPRRVLALSKMQMKVQEALMAGADYAGGEELYQKIIKEKTFDFDVIVASPEMMGIIPRFWNQLPERINLPSPKMGTCTPHIAAAVRAIKEGQVEFKNDKNGVITCPIGKVSFGSKKLSENLRTLADAIMKEKRPAHNCPHCGQFIRSCNVFTDQCQSISIATSYYD